LGLRRQHFWKRLFTAVVEEARGVRFVVELLVVRDWEARLWVYDRSARVILLLLRVKRRLLPGG
jgi:hypothetical protein